MAKKMPFAKKIEKMRKFLDPDNYQYRTLKDAISVFRRGELFSDDLSDYLHQLSLSLIICAKTLSPSINDEISEEMFTRGSPPFRDGEDARATEALGEAEYEGTYNQMLYFQSHYEGNIPREIIAWYLKDAASLLARLDDAMEGSTLWSLKLVPTDGRGAGGAAYPRDPGTLSLIRNVYFKLLENGSNKTGAKDEMHARFDIDKDIIEEAITGAMFPGLRYQVATPDHIVQPKRIQKALKEIKAHHRSSRWSREEFDNRISKALHVKDVDSAWIQYLKLDHGEDWSYDADTDRWIRKPAKAVKRSRRVSGKGK